MGRPVRNLAFNATGNVVSGLAPHGTVVQVFREDAPKRDARASLVGQGTASGATGAFSISCTGLSVGTHVLRVSQRGLESGSDPLTAVVTTAS